MENDGNKPKIKIIKDGPYIVSGNVLLSEKIIVSNGKNNKFEEGREFPQEGTYALCRCGKSKNKPYCDGAHEYYDFNGKETASKAKYEDRADVFEGPDLYLSDDGRCAYARFCHRADGDVWSLAENSDDPHLKSEAIIAANECPSGRLVAYDKAGNETEKKFEPSIEIIQDPDNGVSSGLYVKGYIPIESSDGEEYESRNRVMLCRCGESRRKPFCDATHVVVKFTDKK
jgi:CDGSH-type Zn-finger protein